MPRGWCSLKNVESHTHVEEASWKEQRGHTHQKGMLSAHATLFKSSDTSTNRGKLRVAVQLELRFGEPSQWGHLFVPFVFSHIKIQLTSRDRALESARKDLPDSLTQWFLSRWEQLKACVTRVLGSFPRTVAGLSCSFSHKWTHRHAIIIIKLLAKGWDFLLATTLLIINP